MSKPHLILLLILLLSYFDNIFFCFHVQTYAYNSDSIDHENNNNNNVGVTFELIHRHADRQSISKHLRPPEKRIDRLRQLAESDKARQRVISYRRGGLNRRETFETDGMAAIPMRSASDRGMGQYFVSFRVGTPHPRKFVLIADTGSDLTWMNCKYECDACPKSSPHPGRVFQANESPTFKTIPCSSDTCMFDLAKSFSLSLCPTPQSPCLFDYRYLDGTDVLGVFANETVSVGLQNRKKIKLRDVLIGCGESFNRTFNEADGIMGLGYHKYSFAVRVAEQFGNKFSYCLVDHMSPSNISNFLKFGDVQNSSVPNMQYTDLLLGYMNPYYVVNVSGISMDGVMLKLPPEVWDIKVDGGVIVDSGSSLTFFVEPVYEAVMDAFKLSGINKLKRADVKVSTMEYCYVLEGFQESLVPKLAIHFVDGAVFEPPIKSYVLNADEGVVCLGFSPVGWPGTSVIGNILQQNHLWEFDLGANKLGFGPSSCT